MGLLTVYPNVYCPRDRDDGPSGSTDHPAQLEGGDYCRDYCRRLFSGLGRRANADPKSGRACGSVELPRLRSSCRVGQPCSTPAANRFRADLVGLRDAEFVQRSPGTSDGNADPHWPAHGAYHVGDGHAQETCATGDTLSPFRFLSLLFRRQKASRAVFTMPFRAGR